MSFYELVTTLKTNRPELAYLDDIELLQYMEEYLLNKQAKNLTDLTDKESNELALLPIIQSYLE